MLQYVADRGVIVCTDTQPAPSFPAMTIATMPLVRSGETSEIELHPHLQQALSTFADYAISNRLVQGSNEEARELEGYLTKALSGDTAEDISGMLKNLEKKCEQHTQHCTDEDCSVTRFLKLTAEKLRVILRARLQ